MLKLSYTPQCQNSQAESLIAHINVQAMSQHPYDGHLDTPSTLYCVLDEMFMILARAMLSVQSWHFDPDTRPCTLREGTPSRILVSCAWEWGPSHSVMS